MVGAASEVAIEPQPDEQVVCQDLTGELSNALSEIRKETHNWKTKWRHVFVNRIPQLSTVVCCHEHELCGFVHGDDFIIAGDSVQLMWIESRLKERLNFERCVDLGVDDGDRMVTILNRLVTWSNQVGIEAVPRHRDILRADEHGRIRHLHCLMRWARDADRHIKKFDCANELGAREIREHRNAGIHLHRELSGGTRTCESAWFDTVWMCKGIIFSQSLSVVGSELHKATWSGTSSTIEAMKVGTLKMECGDDVFH